MKPPARASAVVVASLLAVFGLQAVAAEAPPPQGEKVPTAASGAASELKARTKQRLGLIATLIEKSSAARRIEASANPGALARRDKARKLYRDALGTFRTGDFAKTLRLLDEAAEAMFAGVRLTAAAPVDLRDAPPGFKTRLESVKVLLAAQRRISAEKHTGAKQRETGDRIEALVREATALAGAKKYDQAKVKLDRAYAGVKEAITDLRGGDVLVRSLHFATKRDEYRYEIDRNDTYKMLVKVALERKRATAEGAGPQEHVARSARLRAKAEGLAAKGDYGAGIKLLEDSTRELVRAIRSVGIYVPE